MPSFQPQSHLRAKFLVGRKLVFEQNLPILLKNSDGIQRIPAGYCRLSDFQWNEAADEYRYPQGRALRDG